VADEDYQKYFNYFSNDRKFFLPSSLGRIIGKPALFALTNSWASSTRSTSCASSARWRKNSEAVEPPARRPHGGSVARLLSRSRVHCRPDYVRPEIDAPEKYRFAAAEASDLANTQWWKQFHDPKLDELIQIALTDNFDVRIAAARVEEFYGSLG